MTYPPGQDPHGGQSPYGGAPSPYGTPPNPYGVTPNPYGNPPNPYAVGAYGAPPQGSGTDVMGIIGTVLGVLGLPGVCCNCLGIFSLAGLILGIIGLQQAKQQNRSPGLSIAAIVLGGVGLVLVIGFLIFSLAVYGTDAITHGGLYRR